MRSLSLYLRVSIPVLAAVATVTLVIVVLGNIFRQTVIGGMIEERAETLSAAAHNTISRVMLAGHSEELQAVLEELSANRDVAAVRILATDGEVRRSSNLAEIGMLLPQHLRPWSLDSGTDDPRSSQHVSTVVHTVEPISTGQECRWCHVTAGPVIGFIDVDVNVARQTAILDTWWTASLGLAVVQFLTVVAVLVVFLGVLVVRPVRRLCAGMERVRAGDLTTEVTPAGNREMDYLVDGFNQMVARLREAARTEAEAREIQMQRAERLATVGQMAASLAHEIRNPLTGVKAVVDVLVRQVGADDPKRDMLRQSVAALDRIEMVIRDLLDYARPRAPAMRVVDLNAVARDAVALLDAQAAEGKVAIEWHPASDLPLVRADPLMIHQVLVNLIINAIHATATVPDGRVTVSTGCENGEILCRVRDTGPGVPDEHAEAIFEAFFTTKSRGTGLGLATSRRLVETQGGRLWLENPGQAGASFVFSVSKFEPESTQPATPAITA